MSLSSAIDGKLMNRCERAALLDDPDRVRKQLEQEQRKQRLLEVREQSKEIARHIRQNVAAEKQRQLLNLRVIKEREYNCWRDQALAQQYGHDNRHAIFQVGAAHRAAQLEKEQMAAQAAAKAANYKEFRKQLKARRSCANANAIANRENQPQHANARPQPIKKSTLACTATQTTTPCPIRVECHNDGMQSTKRKRDKCNHEKSLCCCTSDSDEFSDDDDEEEEVAAPVGACSSVSSLSSESSAEEKEEQCARPSPPPRSCSKLKQTPAILVDVEVDSSDSITITAPYEVEDNHIETNRQFSAVVRVSPSRKKNDQQQQQRKKQQQRASASPVKAKQTAAKGKAKTKAHAEPRLPRSPMKAAAAPPAAKEKPKSPTKKTATPSKSTAKAKPRYTQVSDLLQSKRDATAEKPATSPRRNRSPVAKESRPLKAPPPSPKSLSKSPRSAATTTKATASSSTAATKSPSKKKQQNSDAASGSLAAGKSNASVSAAVETKSVGCGSTGTASGLVRFYDYNNKFTKCCPSIGNVEREMQSSEEDALSAMEQARMEVAMREAREQEILEMQKRTEQRGQVAMERERVRRDCLELTEKLDTLMQQYPNLLPSHANMQPAYLNAKANARREERSSKAVEEILLRPAIITCPEVTTECNRRSPKKQKSDATAAAPRRPLAYEINLGDTAAKDKDSAIISVTDSSDSCCSLLLGYVNDQSQQVRNDINACGANPAGATCDKATKLSNLLQRIECLRDVLVKEINKASQTSVNANAPRASNNIANMQEMIESISMLHKEHEKILSNGKEGQNPAGAVEHPQANNNNNGVVKVVAPPPANGDDRERLLQQKEAILEQKLREFYELQKQKDTKACKDGNKPLEIIIKVKGDGKCVSKVKKSKKGSRSPRKAPGLIANGMAKTPKKSPTPPITHPPTSISQPPTSRTHPPISPIAPPKAPMAPPQPPKASAAPTTAHRQNSYDSGSTSYHSLPPALGNGVDALLRELINQPNENDEPRSKGQRPKAHLNPLIAHYIQRLLGMSRNCIETLGVSSSDIQTPSSSIINTTGNRSGLSLETRPTEEELGLSQERLLYVEKFIEENRSFVNELEDTMRQQTSQCLEKSMRAFEEVWKQRLCQAKQQQQQQQKASKHKSSSKHDGEKKKHDKTSTSARGSKEQELQGRGSGQSARGSGKAFVAQQNRPSPRGSARSLERSSGSAFHKVKKSQPQGHSGRSGGAEKQRPSKESVHSQQQQQQRMVTRGSGEKPTSAAAPRADVDDDDDEDGVVMVDSNGDKRIARYEQLTSNCTNRIAELTALINRVREEKQRLLEVTLSSVSENGRNSTEYMELPTNKQDANGQSASGAAAAAKRQSPTGANTTPEPSVEAQLPLEDDVATLEKHKSTGRSHDSGISMSRPVTALEQHSEQGVVAPLTEPSSLASTHTVSSNSSQQKAKVRPPATLRRFSPQLSLEEDVAHELSTILEIETPGTTRANNSTIANNNNNSKLPPTTEAPTAAGDDDGDATEMPSVAPVAFPTFEEYAKQLNLDLSQLDPEQSQRVQQEFEELIANLTLAEHNKNFNYQEFPSMTTYTAQCDRQAGKRPPSASGATADAVDDLLACLRLANLTIKSFPSRQEYMKQLGATRAMKGGTAVSEENISEICVTTSETNDSESTLNIEAELMQRNILKHAFRRAPEIVVTEATQPAENFKQANARSSSDETERVCAQLMAESGVDRMTSSTTGSTSIDFERELQSLGMQWPATMRRKFQEANERAAQSSSTSSPPIQSGPTCTTQRSSQRRSREHRQLTFEDSANDCANEVDLSRPINLREFLTKELLKHTSTSCSTSDDSLKSNFLNSIIDNMTPGCSSSQLPSLLSHPPWSSPSNTGACRQKTSTPVNTQSTSSSHGHHRACSTSSNTTHLFSGESHLSSVHCDCRCPDKCRHHSVRQPPDCDRSQ